jgi:hypothetical protein
MSGAKRSERRPKRVRLNAEKDPLRCVPDLAGLSNAEWIEFLLARYPIGVVLDHIGVARSIDDRRTTAGEDVFRRALARDRRVVASDLVDFEESIRRQSAQQYSAKKRARGTRSMGDRPSEEEWQAYLRTHYPRRVIRDLDGIRQSASAAANTDRRAPTRKRASSRHLPRTYSGRRIDRYLSHLIVLSIGGTLISHNVVPLLPVAALGLVAGLAMLLAKDGARSAIALQFRGRSKNHTYKLSLRVKTSSWDTKTSARLLALASLVLPPEYRGEYVEEQYANMLATESKREATEYLLDLILELPRVAWQFYTERRRESAK